MPSRLFVPRSNALGRSSARDIPFVLRCFDWNRLQRPGMPQPWERRCLRRPDAPPRSNDELELDDSICDRPEEEEERPRGNGCREHQSNEASGERHGEHDEPDRERSDEALDPVPMMNIRARRTFFSMREKETNVRVSRTATPPIIPSNAINTA